jgi:hypothetical protein
MATWGEFGRLQPDLAADARDLFYQRGFGLAFLATVRKDGGPRLHPICPLLTEEAMFAFLIPSPKQQDLCRDGRFAVHSFPRPDNANAFSLTGHATVVKARELRTTLGQQFVRERAHLAAPYPNDADTLFEFEIERCLLTRTTGNGDWNPRQLAWHAPRVERHTL